MGTGLMALASTNQFTEASESTTPMALRTEEKKPLKVRLKGAEQL